MLTLTTNCDTIIELTNLHQGLTASFYNTIDGDIDNIIPENLNLIGEVSDVTIGGLMKSIFEYAEENDIDLF